MRGQVNRCAQPLPQSRFQKFIDGPRDCRLSNYRGPERSGGRLDLTTAFEDFQITNVHPPNGYGLLKFRDSIDGDSQLSLTGDYTNNCAPSARRVGLLVKSRFFANNGEMMLSQL